MIDELKLFFKDYPRQIMQMQDVHPDNLPNGLMNRLLDYRRQQLLDLEVAQYFRIDAAAHEMLLRLISEMQRDGLSELYSQVMLPFPTMIVEVADGAGAQLVAGVVVQIDDAIHTQRFILREGDIGPSNCVIISKGLKAELSSTPTYELFTAIGVPVPEGVIKDEMAWSNTVLALTVAITTLLRHDGMLQVEEVSLYPRQLRRQAERAGKQLPDTLISKIVLGKTGRVQLEAMRDGGADGRHAGAPRRAHWVRGHMMRSRSGHIVWRMPHLRGAGSPVRQVRQVTVAAPSGTTAADGSATGDE